MRSECLDGIFCCFEALREAPEMSEAQPKEDDVEGQSRKSGHLIFLRGLIPTLLV